jgi:hypothetical protein
MMMTMINITNSTEPHREFVMKKWVGFTCGMLSAVAATLSSYALYRIVYPMKKNSKRTNNTVNRTSIFIIVLKLFMSTSISDVVYSLNNVLTFSDWNPFSTVCTVRGIWFQIGFQSSFFFTACTAYELYNMINTTMNDSNLYLMHSRNNNSSQYGRYGDGGDDDDDDNDDDADDAGYFRNRRKKSLFENKCTKFQCYIITNITFILFTTMTIYVNDGFGASSRTDQHSLCWVYTTQWTALVAMLPSFFCWILNCIFIGLSIYKLCILSKNTSSSISSTSSFSTTNAVALEDDANNNIKRGFIPVIRKMLLFPLATFILWIVPIVEVIFMSESKNDGEFNQILETTTQVAINLQGLTNMVILLLTNSLVRNEIYSVGQNIWCCCSCLCRRRDDAGSTEEERVSYADQEEDYYYHHSNGQDSGEGIDWYGGDGGSGSGSGGGGGGEDYNNRNQPFLLPSGSGRRTDRRTEPAYSEDVTIMQYRNGRNSATGDSYDGSHRHMKTPSLPSLDGNNGSVQ